MVSWAWTYDKRNDIRPQTNGIEKRMEKQQCAETKKLVA